MDHEPNYTSYNQMENSNRFESDPQVVKKETEKRKVETDEYLQSEITKKQEESALLERSIVEDRERIQVLRKSLDMSPEFDEPHSEKPQKERIQALQEEIDLLKEKQQKSSYSNGSEESFVFKENDLIVGDSTVETIAALLNQHDILYQKKEYTKPTMVDADTDTEVPGEFVLSIFEDGSYNKPASPEYTKEIFGLIQSAGLPVRYAKMT